VEANYYFGGFTDTDDLIRKTQFVQAMSYRSVFEEARFQWPHCSMVVNWCWNEPFACAANNSVISWPAVAKPCHQSIAKALRAQEAALRVSKHLWNAGERFEAEIWMLNDHADILQEGEVALSYRFGDDWIKWGTIHHGAIMPRSNSCCGTFSAPIPADFDGFLHVRLEVQGREDMNSEYTYICRHKELKRVKQLNCDW
jgi:beta-mannosidase